MRKSAQIALAGISAALLTSAAWAQTSVPKPDAAHSNPTAKAAKATVTPQASIAVPVWVLQAPSLDQAKDDVKIRVSKLQIILQGLDRMTPEQFKQWQHNALASQKSAPAPAKK